MTREPSSPSRPDVDRAAVEALDRAHRAESYRRGGPEAALRASRMLREHMRRVRPDWPTEADRAAGLRHRVEMQRLLARVADALAHSNP